jgi:asparagine synthase (glutamine-hydrolysing)
MAAQHVKMVLTGDGGDEVLSGYNAYQIEKFAATYQKVPSFLRDALYVSITLLGNCFMGSMRYKFNQLARALLYASQSYEKRLQMKSSWYIPNMIEEMTKGYGYQIKLCDFISDFYSKYKAEDSFYKLMLFQYKVLLPDDFLTKVDRMSMAYSLETRIPFLDYRLVEFMVNVSKEVKMQGYERKSVLRNTVGKKLPASVLRGPKRGFAVPLREWFKDRNFNMQLSALYSEDFGLNKEVIKKIVQDNKMGKTDLGNFIWMLFVLKEWYCGRGALSK